VAQQPVENYGVIGDMHTVALVGKDGSIDFMCFPRFDSPTIFAALLDPENGGTFQLAPESADARQVQLYLPDTAILLTRFLFAEGVAEVSDHMPVRSPTRALVRRVKTVRGEISFRMRCAPRFDYGRARHRIERRSEREWVFASEGADRVAFLLRSDVPLTLEDGDAVASFRLGAGQFASFILEEVTPGQPAVSSAPDYVSASFKLTGDFWRSLIARSTYRGRWREIVNRSVLTLTLLTSSEHGSMVASPTFGLPEQLGGDRNWDYRYTWIRDASFALYAVQRLGFTHARAFMDWVEARCGELRSDGSLQVMYGIDGRHDLPEETLPHWSGYRHSQPVRIGNAAHGQLQLDIYGELMDAVYLYNKFAEPISHDLWRNLVRLIQFVCAHWREQDEGIWEVRGRREEFLLSRVMCWVAVDRDPAHDPRQEELLAPAAHLRDALVLLPPVGADELDEPHEVAPQVVGDGLRELVVEVDRVHELAVDVELELIVGGVPDAHRLRVRISRPVGQRLLAEVVTAIDPVHDLERAVRAELPAARLDPVHEGASLGEAQALERIQREGGVPDPGVPIVPVAVAPKPLREPERGRSDHGAVLGRGEEHEGQGRAVDHLPPAPPVRRSSDGPPPGVVGPLEARRHVVGRRRHGGFTRGGFLEDERGGLAGVEPEGRDGVPVDERERHVAAEQEGHPVRPVRGEHPLSLRPPLDAVGGAAVVEARCTHHPERALAPDRLHSAHQNPPRGCDRHEVGDLGDALREEEPREQDDGVRKVELHLAGVGGLRSEQEAPAPLRIEQRPEDRRRIEAREAQEVDRPVLPHEGDGVHVADDAVVLDGLLCHGSPSAASP